VYKITNYWISYYCYPAKVFCYRIGLEKTHQLYHHRKKWNDQGLQGSLWEQEEASYRLTLPFWPPPVLFYYLYIEYFSERITSLTPSILTLQPSTKVECRHCY